VEDDAYGYGGWGKTGLKGEMSILCRLAGGLDGLDILQKRLKWSARFWWRTEETG
jgi:hypothetical protein